MSRLRLCLSLVLLAAFAPACGDGDEALEDINETKTFSAMNSKERRAQCRSVAHIFSQEENTEPLKEIGCYAQTMMSGSCESDFISCMHRMQVEEQFDCKSQLFSNCQATPRQVVDCMKARIEAIEVALERIHCDNAFQVITGLDQNPPACAAIADACPDMAQ